MLTPASADRAFLVTDAGHDSDNEDTALEAADAANDAELGEDADSTLDVDAESGPDAIDEDAARALEEESDAHVGVAKVEAAGQVYGKWSRITLFTS